MSTSTTTTQGLQLQPEVKCQWTEKKKTHPYPALYLYKLVSHLSVYTSHPNQIYECPLLIQQRQRKHPTTNHGSSRDISRHNAVTVWKPGAPCSKDVAKHTIYGEHFVIICALENVGLRTPLSRENMKIQNIINLYAYRSRMCSLEKFRGDVNSRLENG